MDSAIDRTEHNATNRNDRSDSNFDDKITKLHDLIRTNVYRIPLQCLVDLGLVNFPTQQH